MNVAVGKLAVSMIRPWNWRSRFAWSLVTLVRSAVKLAVCTVVPLIVMSPVIAVVLPTAVVLWPNSTSGTRYCRRAAGLHLPRAVDRVRGSRRWTTGRDFGSVVTVDSFELRGRIALDEVDVDERAAHEHDDQQDRDPDEPGLLVAHHGAERHGGILGGFLGARWGPGKNGARTVPDCGSAEVSRAQGVREGEGQRLDPLGQHVDDALVTLEQAPDPQGRATGPPSGSASRPRPGRSR